MSSNNNSRVEAKKEGGKRRGKRKVALISSSGTIFPLTLAFFYSDVQKS